MRRRPAQITENLQHYISELKQRVRDLEDALALLQSRVSTETHPLLRDELLFIKCGGLDDRPTKQTESTSSNDTAPEPTVNAFGTLTINDSGEAKYFGGSAGSEVCFTTISPI